METIKINGKVYYNSDDVMYHNKEYFKTCKGRIRNILKLKELKYIDDYLFCNMRIGNWSPIENSIKPAGKDKIFFRKKWCENIDGFTTKVKNRELVKILPMPDQLILTTEEQFCDGDYYYDIEVRGKRNVDECYFSVDSIADVFNIKNIRSKITDKNSSFEPNKDYVRFVVAYDKKYFLTYNGVMKCIYSSKSPISRLFQNWASTTLFTLQLGTIDDKEDLLTSYLGTNAELCKRVFSSIVTPVSCIYFITLGTVKDLKDVFPLSHMDDNHLVCKYGRTNDFKRRIGELMNHYKKKNKTICLEFIHCAFIDDIYSSDAETDMSTIFSIGINKITDIDENELIIIDKKNIPSVRGHYKSIESNYGKNYENIKEKYITDINEMKVNYERSLNEQILKNKTDELAYMKREKKLHNDLVNKDKEMLVLQLEHEKTIGEYKTKNLGLENEMLKLKLSIQSIQHT